MVIITLIKAESPRVNAVNLNIFYFSEMKQGNQEERNKKMSRKDADDLEAFSKYKDAFDYFDWNKTKTIATSVSF